MQYLIPAGMLFVFVGMILIIIGSFFGASGSGRQKNDSNDSSAGAKIAVGGFIGPIPFGFANDRRMMYFVIGLAFALIIFYILFNTLISKKYFG